MLVLATRDSSLTDSAGILRCQNAVTPPRLTLYTQGSPRCEVERLERMFGEKLGHSGSIWLCHPALPDAVRTVRLYRRAMSPG